MRCDRRITEGQWKLMLGERMTWWFSSSTSAFPSSTSTRARRALQMFSGSKFWFSTNTGTLYIALSQFYLYHHSGFIILLEVQPYPGTVALLQIFYHVICAQSISI